MRASLVLLALLPPLFAAQPKKRPEDHIAGKEIWDRSCWQCHGKLNAGDGPAAAALNGGVPDLRNTVTPDRYDALIPIILEGKGMMPAFAAELNEHDAKRILIYLNKLDTEGPPKEPAKDPADDEAPKPATPPSTPQAEPKLETLPAPGGI